MTDRSTAAGDDGGRNVRWSDRRLVTMALDAERGIPWETLRKGHVSSRWSRRKGAASSSARSNSIALFTREDTQSFAVLAKAQLPFSLQELKLVFDARTSEQFRDVMQTLCQREFLAGELVHVVAANGASPTPHSSTSRFRHQRPSSTSSSSSSSTARRTSRVVSTTSEGGSNAVVSLLPKGSDLVVTALTFDKANVFARNEEWCFLDLTHDLHPQDHDDRSHKTKKQAFTKTMLALNPSTCFYDRVSMTTATHGHDVVAGFLCEEDERDPSRTSRLTFSAEHFYQGVNRAMNQSQYGSHRKRSGSDSTASARIVNARLIKMVQWIYHLSIVVRRRRLGIQVLADRRLAGVNAMMNSTKCVCCHRSFLLFARQKKACALCGYAVCANCSELEPRETRAALLERSKIDSVRVCDTCMVRVDQCRYAHVTLEDLGPDKVVADDYDGAGVRARATTTGAALTDLLQETMQHASASRKASALSVIKYLVEQEQEQEQGHDNSDEHRRASTTRRPSVVPHNKILLTDPISEHSRLTTLQSTITETVAPLPLAECVLTNVETRNYPLTYPKQDATKGAILYPVPPNEAARLELIEKQQLLSLGNLPELEIICSIASKELACSGSMVTIVADDTFHVIASTIEAHVGQSFPRNQGFCNQTIMGDQPLLVRHARADVRFAQIIPVADMNVQFYCGFPLFADGENRTVIGSVCCVDHKSRELTQSQYTVMQKLAQTASKVVQRAAGAKQSQVAVL
ncbi:Gaf domain-containing protein, partial [Globisporangium splendens]